MENIIQAIQDGWDCNPSDAHDLLNTEVQKLRTLRNDGILKSTHICEACDRLKISRNMYQFKFIVLLEDKPHETSVAI